MYYFYYSKKQDKEHLRLHNEALERGDPGTPAIFPRPKVLISGHWKRFTEECHVDIYPKTKFKDFVPVAILRDDRVPGRVKYN